MDQFLEIGILRIPIKGIFIGLGLFTAYVAMSFSLRNSQLDKKQLLNSLLNALIIGLIVWKVSYVLFNPLYAIANPLGIIYFNGGQKGIFLSIIIGIIYIHYQAKKQRVAKSIYVNLLILGWLAGSAAFFIYFIEENIIFYLGQMLLSLLLVIRMFLQNIIDGSVRLLNIVMIYSLGQVFLQYFSGDPTLFQGLTLTQVGFVCVVLLILIYQYKDDKV